MINTNFDSIRYNYYANSSSYVKMILDMLPESKVSAEKKQIIKELYNYFMSNFTEDKIKEIATVSAMFREKVAVSSLDSITKNAEYIYVNFLDKIIFDSINRNKYFDIMNECMKVYVGYYSEYNKNNQFVYDDVELESNYAR